MRYEPLLAFRGCLQTEGLVKVLSLGGGLLSDGCGFAVPGNQRLCAGLSSACIGLCGSAVIRLGIGVHRLGQAVLRWSKTFGAKARETLFH